MSYESMPPKRAVYSDDFKRFVVLRLRKKEQTATDLAICRHGVCSGNATFANYSCCPLSAIAGCRAAGSDHEGHTAS